MCIRPITFDLINVNTIKFIDRVIDAKTDHPLDENYYYYFNQPSKHVHIGTMQAKILVPCAFAIS